MPASSFGSRPKSRNFYVGCHNTHLHYYDIMMVFLYKVIVKNVSISMVFVYFSIIVIDKICLILIWGISGVSGETLPTPIAALPAAIQTFTETEERDITLKSKLPLLFLQSHGSIKVEGWVQDRIRVILKKRVLAKTREEANELFSDTDLLTVQHAKGLELQVAKARGKDLLQKLKQRSDQSVQVDIEIRAPYTYPLTLALGEGTPFIVQHWRGGLEVSARSAMGQLSDLDLAKALKINCPGCELQIEKSRFSGHILGTDRPIELSQVTAKTLLIDSTEGSVRLDGFSGNAIVHTTTGKCTGNGVTGEIQFHSTSGGLSLNQVDAKIEAQTAEGQITLEAGRGDKIMDLQSGTGDVVVTIEPSFEGVLDLSSLKGEVVVQFPYEIIRDRFLDSMGPEHPGKLHAWVGRRTGGLIRAESRSGGIRILRGESRKTAKSGQ